MNSTINGSSAVNMSTNGTAKLAVAGLVPKPDHPQRGKGGWGNGTSIAMDSALYKKTFEVACGASVKRFVMRKPSTSEIIATPANQIVAKIPRRYKNVVLQFADTPLPPTTFPLKRGVWIN